MSMLKFLAGQLVPRPLLAALRRMRGGPLPRVSEVDWSEWEHSVAAWEESHAPVAGAGADGGKRNGRKRSATALPEVSESDWAAWEDSMRAIEQAKKKH
jgi:hypothetical protein